MFSVLIVLATAALSVNAQITYEEVCARQSKHKPKPSGCHEVLKTLEQRPEKYLDGLSGYCIDGCCMGWTNFGSGVTTENAIDVFRNLAWCWEEMGGTAVARKVYAFKGTNACVSSDLDECEQYY